MKTSTYIFFFLNSIKNLKRNATTTFISILIVSGAISIVGLFLMYIFSVNMNREILFTDNEEMIIFLKWITILVFTVVPLFSVFFIVNSSKIGIFSRRNEINIMKLIGATDCFIGVPFIIEGLVTGILGALIGNLFLFCIYTFLYIEGFGEILGLNLVDSSIVSKMLFPFILYGAFVSVIGNIIALRKSLKML